MTERLPRLTPNAARSQRTLAQCQKKLAGRRPPIQPAARQRAPVTNLERAALITLAAAFVVSMADTVLRIMR